MIMWYQENSYWWYIPTSKLDPLGHAHYFSFSGLAYQKRKSCFSTINICVYSGLPSPLLYFPTTINQWFCNNARLKLSQGFHGQNNVRFYRYLYVYAQIRHFRVKVPGLLVNHIGSLKSLTFLKPDFSGVGLVCEIPHRLHKPFMSSGLNGCLATQYSVPTEHIHIIGRSIQMPNFAFLFM